MLSLKVKTNKDCYYKHCITRLMLSYPLQDPHLRWSDVPLEVTKPGAKNTCKNPNRSGAPRANSFHKIVLDVTGPAGNRANSDD